MALLDIIRLINVMILNSLSSALADNPDVNAGSRAEQHRGQNADGECSDGESHG